MSRTHKDKVQYTIASLFREIRKLNGRDDCYTAWDTYADYVDQWWVRGRMNRSGNKRKLMARLKVQYRRRARRELEREVLDPFVYTRKGSEAEYDHACRYEGETYGAQWADWEWYTCGSNYREDDAFDEEVERCGDSGYDYDVPWEHSWGDWVHEDDRYVPGYTYQDFSKSVSLSELLGQRDHKSRLRESLIGFIEDDLRNHWVK